LALIPPLGTLCAHLGLQFGGWVPAAGLVSLASVLVIGALIKFRAGEITPGITTNLAALLMYVVGAILALDMKVIAVMMGGCVAVLLHLKDPMPDTFIRTLGTLGGSILDIPIGSCFPGEWGGSCIEKRTKMYS
jgi:uncharacterized membrane protein (DUF4010 family)